MQIVSRRTMLALPVERLVGNSTNNNNGSRTRPPMMTMSPDSSPSDSSRSESPSSTNAKVYSAYSSPNSDKFRSDSTSPPPKSSSRTGESEDPAHDQPHRCSCDNNEDIQFKTEHNNSNSTRDERKEGSNQTEPQPAAAELKQQQQQQKIRIIEDDTESLNNKMNNTVGDDSDDNNSIGRPPSRPPSSASSTFTTASTLTFPLSPNSDIKPIPMITRPFHHHHHHHHHHNHHHLQTLKFSIEDILRPEFGKSALRRQPLANNHRRSSNINSNNGDFYPHSPSSIRNNKEGRDKPNRPSSIKDHSEDSNSSCTSRKEEVVDESKVNPPVPPGPLVWPAWVYCTRYSDRPSSGPRSRRVARKEKPPGPREVPEEKRPRTAFTAEQLARLKQEFDENRYLTEKRRQDLARDLKLHENQIKIWFQNKRAKLKKSTGARGGLAMQLMAQGLYNHSTVPIDEDDEMYEALMQNK